MASRMAVGVLRLVLHLPESGSLKSKRMVVRSVLSRVRNEFQVAAAEVGEHDRWQLAELAFASVSADAPHAERVLQRVLRFVEENAADAIVSDVSTETIRL